MSVLTARTVHHVARRAPAPSDGSPPVPPALGLRFAGPLGRPPGTSAQGWFSSPRRTYPDPPDAWYGCLRSCRNAVLRLAFLKWGEKLPDLPAAALAAILSCSQAVDDLGLLLAALRILCLVGGCPWVRTVVPLGVSWSVWVALRAAARFEPLPKWGQLRVDQVSGAVFRSFYIIVVLVVLSKLLVAWRRRDVSGVLPGVLLLGVLLLMFLAYAFWSAFIAEYLRAEAVFAAAYVMLRVTVYSLMVLACREIGSWASWEHRLPVLSMFFVGPSSGLRLVSRTACPRTGHVYFEKESIRSWTARMGTAALRA